MSTDAPIRITLEQEEDYSFRIRFDDTTIADLMTDEPAPLGKGEGPNPTRLLVSAVANCLSASLLFALRKFRNTPGRLVTHATAELVRNEQGRLRVGHIHADIQLAEAGTAHASLERILAQFENFCVVTESVRHGIEVSVSITDADGVQPSDGEEAWHGFGDMAPGFNMLDPIKATIVTPGLNMNGDFAATGIPASIVTKFLAEHGVVVEKTGLYSFFIMFTIGITKGRWNTLLTALQQFKDDYAKNQPMWRILPEFCQKHPRYEQMGLRDLCQHVHALYARYDIARLTTEMYLSDLTPAMKPSDAFAHIAQRTTERVPIDQLEGRITTSLVTPYPPGIPLLIPGEVFNKKIVDYLKFNREFARECPGFETDIHGLVQERGVDGVVSYFADCVGV